MLVSLTIDYKAINENQMIKKHRTKPKTKNLIRFKKKKRGENLRKLIGKSKFRPLSTSKEANFETHPESFRLRSFNWEGMITLKFLSYSHYKDDLRGEGRNHRMNFLDSFMFNLRGKFKLSEKEFQWVAAEEFGISVNGHLHVLFSFDSLKAKRREDKIPQTNFAENGEFQQVGEESKGFVCQKLGLKPQTVDFHWSPKIKNEGLVDYFCKVESSRAEKFFKWSKFWPLQN